VKEQKQEQAFLQNEDQNAKHTRNHKNMPSNFFSFPSFNIMFKSQYTKYTTITISSFTKNDQRQGA
jgi:hypothetical protein